MSDRTTSPQRSPGLRRVKAMQSTQFTSPITPGPNAFALRKAALESTSDAAESSSSHSQRSSKSFSQKRAPTPSPLNSGTTQQTQWPLSGFSPVTFDGTRRCEPVSSKKVEKANHRPTASNEEKQWRDEKLKQTTTPESKPHTPGKGSTEQKSALFEKLIRESGSSIANIRRRVATPPPLNLEASKLLGQSLTFDLRAVQPEQFKQPEQPPSPKKSTRNHIPFPSLKPTLAQPTYTPEPVKLSRNVPRKAAEVLGARPSKHMLSSSARDHALGSPRLGEKVKIEDRQSSTPQTHHHEVKPCTPIEHPGLDSPTTSLEMDSCKSLCLVVNHINYSHMCRRSTTDAA